MPSSSIVQSRQAGRAPGDRAKMNGYTVWVRATVNGYPRCSMPRPSYPPRPQAAARLQRRPAVGALIVKIKDPRGYGKSSLN